MKKDMNKLFYCLAQYGISIFFVPNPFNEIDLIELRRGNEKTRLSFTREYFLTHWDEETISFIQSEIRNSFSIDITLKNIGMEYGIKDIFPNPQK